MGIDGPTYYLSQDDERFLDNDFDDYDLSASRVSDNRKVRLKLQSGHNSRRLDFIFDLFMERVKFIFYFVLICFFAQRECVKRNLIGMGTYLLVLGNSFPKYKKFISYI